MKKKVLCAFALVLYLMAACTILSVKIEEEMTVLVTLEHEVSSKITGKEMEVESRALFVDKEGQWHLFEVLEGDAWAAGPRAQEVFGYGNNSNGSWLYLYGMRDYDFIHFASRNPQAGKLVKVVEEFETSPDQILLYYKNGLPQGEDFPPNMDVIGQTDHAYLMDMPKARFPFLPHSVRTLTVLTDVSDQVISLTETELFLKELPKVAKVLAILIFGILLWLLSCFLSIHAEDHKVLILVNVGLAALLLVYLRQVLQTIDLPASMLPDRNILDLSFYADTLDRVFSSLQAIGRDDFNLIGASAMVIGEVKKVLMIGGTLSAAAIAAEVTIAARLRK